MSATEMTEALTLSEREEPADPLSTSPLPRRRWTREEYYRAAEAGIFMPNERLELIDGEVYAQVSPQNSPHAWSIVLTASALRGVLGEGFITREEKPIIISDDTEPEPDLAVVKGSPRDYTDHPTSDDVVLLVEVSDTTYGSDTRFKASLYASEGVPDYWVLNLKKRELEVCREPAPDPKARFGWSYQEVKTYAEGQSASPLAAPGREVKVEELLPPSPALKEKESPADADDSE